VAAASFDATQRKIRSRLDALCAFWSHPRLCCEWEYVCEWEHAAQGTGGAVGPAAMVDLRVCLEEGGDIATTTAVGACLCLTSGARGCSLSLEPLGGVSSLAASANGQATPRLALATPAALLRGLCGPVSSSAAAALVHCLAGRVLLSALASRALALQLEPQLSLELSELLVKTKDTSRTPGAQHDSSAWVRVAVPPLGAAPYIEVRLGSAGGALMRPEAVRQLEGLGQLEQLVLLLKRELRV